MQIWAVPDKITDSFAILGMAGGVLATLIIGEFRRRLLPARLMGQRSFNAVHIACVVAVSRMRQLVILAEKDSYCMKYPQIRSICDAAYFLFGRSKFG
jgi:hypothetical protein